MRTATLAAAALVTAFTATPALADHHAGDAAMEAALNIESILQHPRRSEDRARDAWRHPAEALAFFQLEPDMRVVEYGPGGGWYTRVLMPYLAPSGVYMALQGDTGPLEPGQAPWAERFMTAVAEGGWGEDGTTYAFESDEIPEDIAGTADRVLIFRSLHGLLNSNNADRELRAIRSLLADDGYVGVVQHRAPEAASWEMSNGSRGYLRQSDVVRLFELNGFELYAQSEVNANPNDTADYPRGVWTLPPTLTLGDEDRARYEAIGESDRMTLLFRKRS